MPWFLISGKVVAITAKDDDYRRDASISVVVPLQRAACSVQRALLVLVLVLVLPVEISGCFAVQLNKWGLITWDSWWSWSCRSFTASASTYFIPTDRYHSGVGSVDGRTNSNPNYRSL